jgi:muramidase (phage lysozyme)
MIKPDILKSAGLLRNVPQESAVEPAEHDPQHVLREMEGHAFAAEANEYRAKLLDSTLKAPVQYESDEYARVMRHDEFADSSTPAPAPAGAPSSAGGSVRRDPFSRPPVVMANQPRTAPGEPVFRDDAAFEQTRKEAEVLVDDSPLGRFTPFKPGFTRNRLFEDIPEAVEEQPQYGTFDEAFAAERAAGEDVFSFDKGQGKGLEQFTTKLAEEAPAPEEPQVKVGPIIATVDPIEAIRKLVDRTESMGGQYDVLHGGENDKGVLNRTVAENIKKHGNTAIGRYQIQGETAEHMLRRNGADISTFKFDQAGQDQLYLWILEYRGLEKFKAGLITLEEFAHNLSMSWAGLPRDASGISFWNKVNDNKASASWEEILDALN